MKNQSLVAIIVVYPIFFDKSMQYRYEVFFEPILEKCITMKRKYQLLKVSFWFKLNAV